MARRKFGHEGSLPLFPTDSTWKPPSLSDLPSWSNAKELAIDSEFWDPTIRELGIGARRETTYVAGVSFMIRGDKPRYLSLRHPEGNVDNPDKALAYVRDNAAAFSGSLLGANVTGDLDLLDVKENIKFDFNKITVYDVQILDALVYELHRSYSLESIGTRRGIPGKDKELLKKFIQDHGYPVEKSGWEKYIAKMPASGVGPYGEHDVSCLFPIFDSLWADIVAQNLHDVVKIECQLLPVLLEMRQRGIRINFDQLDKVEQWSIAEEMETLAKIKAMSGVDIGFNNCNAAAAVAPALLAVGVPLSKTAACEADASKKTQWSITTEMLEGIDHKIGKLIRYLRQVNKIRRTYVASIHKYQTNGRIHGTLRQIVGASEKNEKSGAAYGRLSHAHPNTGAQPSRGKHAAMWRDIYLPEEGQMLLSSDFSAQEPRWCVSFSSLLGLTGAETLAEEYRTNPRVDPHSALAKMVYGPEFTKDDRTRSKTIYLARSYNQGSSKLCKKELKLPTRWKVSWRDGREECKQYFDNRAQAVAFRKQLLQKCNIVEVAGVEGQAIADRFDAAAPFLKELNRAVTEKVEKTGFLRILGGRVLHFPLNDKGEYDFTYKALNRLIQGSAGYQTKLAMIALHRDCKEFAMHLQVHDELIGSIWEIGVAKRVGEIMRDIVKARVPFRCESEIGYSLGKMSIVCNVEGCTNMADPIDKFGCSEHALKVA